MDVRTTDYTQRRGEIPVLGARIEDHAPGLQRLDLLAAPAGDGRSHVERQRIHRALDIAQLRHRGVAVDHGFLRIHRDHAMAVLLQQALGLERVALGIRTRPQDGNCLRRTHRILPYICHPE